MAQATRARKSGGYAIFDLPEFSGGLNLQDAPTELALNESPDLWNVTLDEKGGVTKRLGFSQWNSSAAGNLITYGYYSRVVDRLLWYSMEDGKMYSDPGSGTFTLRKTFTSGSRICIVDFAGKVYAIHPVDGLFQSVDGTTWTATTATSGNVPVGDLLAVWQNKLYVAGDPAATTRLYFSAAGDPRKWDSADGAGFNDVREGRDGDAPIVALFGATGSFVAQTSPSLLVFKQRSTHRVTDSSTAAYVTIDAAQGAAGRDAVTTAYGRIYTVTGHGIYETDGLSPMVPVGQKLEPQFTPLALNFAKESQFAAGAQNGRLYFSVTRIGSTVNDLCIEYHPLFKAFTARSDVAACYVSYTKQADTLLGGSPTATGRVYKFNNGGADDTADIRSRFLTRVFEPVGVECRAQKLTVRVGGTTRVQVLTDFATDGDTFDLSVTAGVGFKWGTDTWGVGVWGAGDKVEEYVVVWPRTTGTAFQLRFDEVSSLTRSGSALLGGTYQPTVGAWGLFGAEIACNQLSPL